MISWSFFYLGGYIVSVIFFSVWFTRQFGSSNFISIISSGLFSLIVSTMWPVFVGLVLICWPVGKIGQIGLRYWTKIKTDRKITHAGGGWPE